MSIFAQSNEGGVFGISMPQLVHGYYHSTAMKTGGLIINFLVLSIAFETSNQIWGYFHGLHNHQKDKPTKLIGGLEHFLFSHSVGNIIIPTDELIFFRGVGLNHQPLKLHPFPSSNPPCFFFRLHLSPRPQCCDGFFGEGWAMAAGTEFGHHGPGHVLRSKKVWMCQDQRGCPYGYGSIPINTIFSGMNIHLPAILMFTRGTRF